MTPEQLMECQKEDIVVASHARPPKGITPAALLVPEADKEESGTQSTHPPEETKSDRPEMPASSPVKGDGKHVVLKKIHNTRAFRKEHWKLFRHIDAEPSWHDTMQKRTNMLYYIQDRVRDLLYAAPPFVNRTPFKVGQPFIGLRPELCGTNLGLMNLREADRVKISYKDYLSWCELKFEGPTLEKAKEAVPSPMLIWQAMGNPYHRSVAIMKSFGVSINDANECLALVTIASVVVTKYFALVGMEEELNVLNSDSPLALMQSTQAYTDAKRDSHGPASQGQGKGSDSSVQGTKPECGDFVRTQMNTDLRFAPSCAPPPIRPAAVRGISTTAADTIPAAGPLFPPSQLEPQQGHEERVQQMSWSQPLAPSQPEEQTIPAQAVPGSSDDERKSGDI